jgi:pimeloyl-ACP methyl ester carboxylesterase
MVMSYTSLLSGFEDYLKNYNDGRPIILIGHSQGASIAIKLIQSYFDANAALRNRLVMAVILGGNVVVPTGKLVGGSFSHIPLCSSLGQPGCVIAYSSFPGEPPAASLFGRPGQGVSLMAGQTATKGLQVACTNPAALSGGGPADLDPVFPTYGLMATPWAEFPALYSGRCESEGGATWLQVTKITGASDRRPVVTEKAGPDWGYHVDDVNLALGNLLADVAAAEASWSRH